MTTDTVRDRARQIPGEPAFSRGEPVDIAAVLGALEARSTPELRTEWRRLYRARPPRRLSRDLLLRAVAHRLQERVHGGLALTTRHRLNALTEELVAKGAAQFDPGTTLKPGTRLVREWHGRAHAVSVLEDGFEYDGQRYRSLTRIASLITGVHWSGPIFFGLKKRPRVQAQASR
jgi:hypothetical protein